ncbi:conserved hypothetical protein [Rhodopseudomonas palustris HaA2]|uniref:Uncharacterized protein n=1 Tax=Rhodopseudomonas palustris (strain HaA2) TaxID=316058 RepID=Q2IT98_RHOP2|nr:hypothetical protein [Rhodopseudomonas palustris]ABD08562.1 conserved hypothetical protein [Rhodopseudomonas palustris HaA2]
MTDFRTLTSLHLAIALAATALPSQAQAQWWPSRAPVDYEDCIEKGEKTAEGKDAKAALAAQCDAKFAGRRKPDGGYSYFDFMQNRSFDIAGPNPTAEELRKMDEQYTAFLDQRRKTIIAAAFAAKQQQIAALSQSQPPAEARPVAKPQSAVDKSRPTATKQRQPTDRPRSNDKQRPARATKYACNTDPVSCGWDHLSSGLAAVKTSLFGPAPKKRQAN